MDSRSSNSAGLPGSGDAFDDDPFAELARLIDEPWASTKPAIQMGERVRPSADGRDGEPEARSDSIGRYQAPVAASPSETFHYSAEEPDSFAELEAALAFDDGETQVPQPANGIDGANPRGEDARSSEPARPAIGADPQERSLDPQIAGELGDELESFAASLEEAVEPARAKPSRPSFGAGMFGPNTGRTIEQAKRDKLAASVPVAAPEPSVPVSPAVEARPSEEPVASDFDTEFAFALEGLSTPADPLAGRVGKTEAFAPDRRAEDDEAPAIIDDFDSLLASEMATLNLDRGRGTSDLPSQETPGDAMHAEDGEPTDRAEPLPRIFGGDGRNVAQAGGRAFPKPANGNFRITSRKLAASVAGLVLIGGAAMFVFSEGGETSGDAAPLIIKADTDPVKIAPSDPGGRQVANQDNATYERVANVGGGGEPTQSMLVSAAERPLALPQQEPQKYEGLPGVNSSAFEVAVSDSPEGADDPILQPRRVRTVTVLPDGTIVAGEDAESVEPISALIETASASVDDRMSVGGISVPGAGEEAMAGEASATGPESAGVPAPNVPIPGNKPSSGMRVASAQTPTAAQEAPTTQMAAVQSQASAPAADAWYVQMSSQPTNEAARSSAATINSRYGNIVSGRPLVIQSADIPGKGTYHRVRMAAASREEAINLCERMKSAGGNCFVAR